MLQFLTVDVPLFYSNDKIYNSVFMFLFISNLFFVFTRKKITNMVLDNHIIHHELWLSMMLIGPLTMLLNVTLGSVPFWPITFVILMFDIYSIIVLIMYVKLFLDYSNNKPNSFY